MDVISLGKANQAIRNTKQLDQEVVAPLAEDRFPTVDHRLDWLESQAEKAISSNSVKVDLSKGTFNNVEYINQSLKLEKIEEIIGSHEDSFDKNIEQRKTIEITLDKPIAEEETIITFYGTTSSYYRFPSYGLQIYIDGIEVYWVSYPKSSDFSIDINVNLKGRTNFTVEIFYGATSGGDYNVKSNFIVESLVNVYTIEGSWESSIIDLSEGWLSTNLVDIEKQVTQGVTDCILEASYSDYGKTFSDFQPLDLNNPPQGRYVKLKAILSSSEDGTSESGTSTQTPILNNIQMSFDETTIEGRLKDLEKGNAINLAKLNFKTNSLLKSEKYKLHDLIIDTFEDDTLIPTDTEISLYDLNTLSYKGIGSLETEVELLPQHVHTLMIHSDQINCTFDYSLDNGQSWVSFEPDDTYIKIVSENEINLVIRINLLEETSEIKAISYGWA